MIVSFLPEKNEWYASLVKYSGQYATGKEVMLSNQHEDLETCLRNLAERFLVCIGKGPTNAIDELNRLCFGEKS